MHINAFLATYHVTEGCQRRSSSCRICHACTAMQILQICFFPVGYDILPQCIIKPVKGAHGSLIQNIASTSYYSTVSNSKTSRECSRTNAWLRLNAWSCRSAKKKPSADNQARHETMPEMIYQRQLQISANRDNLSSTESSGVKQLEKERNDETPKSDPENDDEVRLTYGKKKPEKKKNQGWFFSGFFFPLLKLKNLLRWSFFTFIYYRSSIMNYFIYTSHHFTPHGRYELNKLTLLPMCGFIAQLVEQQTS